MNTIRSLRLLALAAAAVMALSQAQAAAVTYTDRAVFTAAAGSLTNIDFEAQATVANGFTNVGGGLSVSGVNFAAPLSSYMYVAAANAVGNSYQWGSGASLLFGSTNESGNLVITLAPGTFSFGFDLMAEADTAPDGTGGLNYSINIDGNPFGATTSTRPTRAFFGITSDTAMSTVILTMTNTYNYRSLPIIDNVSFGAGNTVAEPGSLALAGLALLGLAGARSRRVR